MTDYSRQLTDRSTTEKGVNSKKHKNTNSKVHTHSPAPTDLVDPRAVLRARRRTAPLRAVSGLAWKRIPVTLTRLPLYEGWNCAFHFWLQGPIRRRNDLQKAITIVSGL